MQRDGRHFKTTESKRRTLAEMIDRYIKDIIPSKPKNVKNRTLHLNWWKSELGEYALAEVTPALIAEHRDKLSRGITRFGEKRSPSTVIRYMAALSHAQSYYWLVVAERLRTIFLAASCLFDNV